ncbi:hypothetical protein GOV07_02910 [Candidatus Woesearchaeota archaeon]|nr:hypothetical protein [Candidatus Woesearchaeota archaeon]
MARKKGVAMIEMLVALLIGLALVGVGWYLVERYGYDIPNQALGEVTSCSSFTGIGGQGQCLRDKNCEGRPAWQYRTELGCEDPLPFCCQLLDKDIADYFIPGSLIISYEGENYRLTPGEFDPGKEIIDKENPTILSRDRVSAQKTDALSIYYRPHMGSGNKPADQSCSLTVNYEGGSKVVKRIDNCYQEAALFKHNWVLIWEGSGASFQMAIDDEKGKNQPKWGYGFTMDAQPKEGTAVSQTYTASLKVVK